MEANELRIGNILRDRKEGTNICFTSFYGLCNFERNIDKYEPIPLTEEILTEWCGLAECLGTYGCRKLSSVVFKEAKGRKGYFFLLSKDGEIITSVIYLHQLQNLYFAISGEELQIKIPNNYEREISIV